jgi:hypothetical protein
MENGFFRGAVNSGQNPLYTPRGTLVVFRCLTRPAIAPGLRFLASNLTAWDLLAKRSSQSA